jgi:hypothetical protein
MSCPWVVMCKGCGCVIVCFATDPQVEHMNPAEKPPGESAQVTCSCCWKTFRYAGNDIARGTPKQNAACVRRRMPAKSDGALLVAASIVAAIRLRGQDIKPSPKLTIVVKDSVALARTVLAQIERS